MMNDPISNGGFINMPFLWVANVKISIISVFVLLAHQIPPELKDVLLQILFEFQNVWLFGFANLKFLPCQKQVFNINNFIK